LICRTTTCEQHNKRGDVSERRVAALVMLFTSPTTCQSINRAINQSFICSVNTSNNKSLQQKVHMSKTCQARLSTCGSLTRNNKEFTQAN